MYHTFTFCNQLKWSFLKKFRKLSVDFWFKNVIENWQVWFLFWLFLSKSVSPWPRTLLLIVIHSVRRLRLPLWPYLFLVAIKYKCSFQWQVHNYTAENDIKHKYKKDHSVKAVALQGRSFLEGIRHNVIINPDLTTTDMILITNQRTWLKKRKK